MCVFAVGIKQTKGHMDRTLVCSSDEQFKNECGHKSVER